jgi:hypothetical protein
VFVTGEPAESNAASAPSGFLLLSDAIHRLRQGMFGSFIRPDPVGELSRKGFKAKFGPWTERAADSITTAGREGELRLYVFGNPQAYAGKGGSEIIPVPASVLRQLVPSRGGFPDHPRATLKAAGKDPGLYNALNTGLLVVSEEEFDIWYRRERSKGRWPSQSSKLKKVGRPTKQTKTLRNAVNRVLEEPKMSIAAVHRQLVASGLTDVPSVDTLGRLIRQIALETGAEKFRRLKRLRSNWSRAFKLPQNPISLSK